jgi:hypothetical protein
MRSMNCRVIRRKIEEAGLDQYPGDLADAHLRACEPCRDFQRERAALSQLLGSLEMVSAPDDFDFRLRARLAASKGAGRQGFFRFLPAPGAHAIAYAAAFALLVSVAVVFKQVQFSAPTVHQGAEVAVAAPAPSSGALPSQASTSERNDSDASNASLGTAQKAHALVKIAEGGSKNLTAEPKLRSRSNRILKPGDERVVQAPANAPVAGPGNNTLEFSSRPAPVISLVAVQVPTTDQPMRVSLEDWRGTTRTVSLQPVTFGSQELIEHKGEPRVIATSPRGIW